MDDSHDDPEKEYLYDRAEQELEQAQRADHPAAVKAHYTLAGYYLDRVYGPAPADEAPPPPEEDKGAMFKR